MSDFQWDEEVPDFIEPITAARAWFLTRRGLSSLAIDHAWYPRRTDRARCADISWGLSHIDPAPEQACSCGFWGVCSPHYLYRYLRQHHKNLTGPNWFVSRALDPATPLVFGTIELTGRVIPGSRGWRAEKARISALMASPDPGQLGYLQTMKTTSSAKLTFTTTTSSTDPGGTYLFPAPSITFYEGALGGPEVVYPTLASEEQLMILAARYGVEMLQNWPALTPPIVKEEP